MVEMQPISFSSRLVANTYGFPLTVTAICPSSWSRLTKPSVTRARMFPNPLTPESRSARHLSLVIVLITLSRLISPSSMRQIRILQDRRRSCCYFTIASDILGSSTYMSYLHDVSRRIASCTKTVLLAFKPNTLY